MLRKVIKAGIGFSNLQPTDIVLAAYPKSGSTWLRFILCNWLNLIEIGSKVVTFDMVNRIMPEIGVSNLAIPWQYAGVPRFVKTHWRKNPLFGSNSGVLLITRDPRDVMVSLHHHLTSRKQRTYSGSLQDLLRDKNFGLESWFKHTRSWYRAGVALIQYEELKIHGVSVLGRALEELEVEYDLQTLHQAYELSGFDQMKKIEAESGVSRNIFKEGRNFVRSGKSAQWVNLFTTSDVELYSALLGKYRGSLPAGLLL